MLLVYIPYLHKKYFVFISEWEWQTWACSRKHPAGRCSNITKWWRLLHLHCVSSCRGILQTACYRHQRSSDVAEPSPCHSRDAYTGHCSCWLHLFFVFCVSHHIHLNVWVSMFIIMFIDVPSSFAPWEVETYVWLFPGHKITYRTPRTTWNETNSQVTAEYPGLTTVE